MISSKSRKLADILEAENYRFFDPVIINYQPKESTSIYPEIQEVFREHLQGKSDPFPLKLSFPLVHDSFVLVLDEELSFHRYRLKTMKSSVYEKLAGINSNQYKRYCRNYEQNCLKAGLKNGLWSNEKAKKLFGKPSEAGDFFANSSPGWKLKSFLEFLQDVYALQNRWNFHRISIYDNLLVDRQLQPLGKLLETGHDKYAGSILKFLKLKLKLPAQ